MCKNKIQTARFWSKISRVLSIFFPGFCLLVAYSLLEKVIEDNLIIYVISLVMDLNNGNKNKKYFKEKIC